MYMPDQAVDMQAIESAIQRRKDGSMNLPVRPEQENPVPSDVPVPVPSPSVPPALGPMVPPQGSASAAVETQESNIIVKGLIKRLAQFTS